MNKDSEMFTLTLIQEYEQHTERLLKLLNKVISDFMKDNPDTIYIYDKYDIKTCIDIVRAIINDKSVW